MVFLVPLASLTITTRWPTALLLTLSLADWLVAAIRSADDFVPGMQIVTSGSTLAIVPLFLMRPFDSMSMTLVAVAIPTIGIAVGSVASHYSTRRLTTWV